MNVLIAVVRALLFVLLVLSIVFAIGVAILGAPIALIILILLGLVTYFETK